jgi:hypothetical protein
MEVMVEVSMVVLVVLVMVKILIKAEVMVSAEDLAVGVEEAGLVIFITATMAALVEPEDLEVVLVAGLWFILLVSLLQVAVAVAMVELFSFKQAVYFW